MQEIEIEMEQDTKEDKKTYGKVIVFVMGLLLALSVGTALANPVSEFFNRLSLQNELEETSEEIGLNKGIYQEKSSRKAELPAELKEAKAKVKALDEEWKSIDAELERLTKKNDELRAKKEIIKNRLGK